MTTDAELRERLGRVEDRAAIRECMMWYEPGMDRRDLFVGADREPANHMTLSGGRYVDRLERRDGRWAIADRICVVEWNAESTSFITDEVIAMTAGSMKVATDEGTDPSYDRPLVASVADVPS